MEKERFMGAVGKMRGLQKAYFRTRDPAVLHQAKFAEQHVDRLLAEWEQEKGMENQPELFEGGTACQR